MNCLYCQKETIEIPGLWDSWQCSNCPHRIRFIGNKICIFVPHNHLNYVLSWEDNKIFSIYLSNSRRDQNILRTPISINNYMPNVITPDNAYQKLLTFLTFS
jgi:hypothetical protein